VDRRVLLVIFGVFAVIVTLISFIVLRSVSGKKADIERYDKAELSYERADEYLEKGERDRAVSGLVTVVNLYPRSQYAEKSLRKLAQVYSAEGDHSKAGYYYRRLLKYFPDVKDAQEIRADLESSNMKRLLTPDKTEDSLEYTVQPGDSLYAIAKKFNTTIALIKKMNGLTSDIIRPGQHLKINVANFTIYIDRANNFLVLNKDGEPFKTYPVATGKNGSTPLGNFVITEKMVRPPWTNPDGQIITYGHEEYELGERWLGISLQGYGIHGTKDETTIGKDVTAGCVRMYNDDVIELYDMVTGGTEVVIADGKK